MNMQQPSMDILAFQRKFATEQACRKHLFKLRWPDGYRCPRCGHEKYSYHSTRRLYQCKGVQVSGVPHSRDGISQNKDPFKEVVLDDLLDVPPKEWSIHVVIAEDA
jgi:hypothetical protein